MLELNLGDTPEKLKEEYLDVYKDIQSEILSTIQDLMRIQIQAQHI